MKLVLRVFIPQETCTKQIHQTLSFTTFDPQYQLELLIFHLQVNSTAVIWHLSLSLWFIDFNRFLTAPEILTIFFRSAGVIWPFLKNWRTFWPSQFILSSMFHHCRSFFALSSPSTESQMTFFQFLNILHP